MKRVVFLISGNDYLFRYEITKLGKFLTRVGCEKVIVMLGTGPISTLWHLWKTVKTVKSDDIFLLTYNGHGNLFGWENWIPYFCLKMILRRLKGKLMVVNDTCYGYHLLPLLQEFRSPNTTCFISAWDSHGLSGGGPVRDMIRFWPQNMVIEDYITGHIYTRGDRDIEVPPQIRWGAQFDNFFFPS